MNLYSAIEAQARIRPQAVALIYGQRVVCYGELVAIVRTIAARLARQGVTPGSTIGITMGNSPLHLAVLLALASLGAISVGVHPLQPRAGKQAVVDEFGVTAIVSNQAKPEIDGIPWIVVDARWLVAEGQAAGGDSIAGEGVDAPWRIALSSGTTGRPKGVLQTHEQTLNLTLLQRTAIPLDPDTRFLVLMDVNATANVMRILRHLLAGSAIVFPRTVQLLESVLDAIDRHGVTHTLVSPHIAGAWTRALAGQRQRARTLTHLSVAGGRVSGQLRQAIVERLTSHVYINYGTTETGMVAVSDPETQQRHPESVGHVVPWARVQIVDQRGQPLPAGSSGIVRFRSVGAATGYYRNAEASARTFRDGWVYPGDVGRVLPDGALVIESRTDDVINVGGSKIEPGGIEDALCLHPDVVDAAVFGAKSAHGGEILCAAVVLREGATADERSLVEHCKERLGVNVPRRVIPLPELPRNQMGKIIRQELLARVGQIEDRKA